MLAAAILAVVILAPLANAQFSDAAVSLAPIQNQYRVVPNVTYLTANNWDAKLDLYLPKGHKDFPVLIFVHGGTWKSGSKDLYGGLGKLYARNGIGTVIINYRLSPKVKHPAHIALDHIAKHIGRRSLGAGFDGLSTS